MAERVIQRRYKLQDKISDESNGQVYSAKDLQTQQFVSVKIVGSCFSSKFLFSLANIQKREINPRGNPPVNLLEAKIYQKLRGGVGIPDLKWAGTDKDDYILVLDMLEPNLEYIYDRYGRRFSVRSVLSLAEQMIDRVEYVHSRGFVHRNIKPDIFLMRGNWVYISDFGLSKRYIQQQTNTHIPFREGKSLEGSARYASLNAHLGFEQSRRDDLEALGYVLLYLLNGGLPWQNEEGATKEETNRKIHEGKRNSTEELCRKYPIEFGIYMGYCKTLEFDQDPNYRHLQNLFRGLSQREGYSRDNPTIEE